MNLGTASAMSSGPKRVMNVGDRFRELPDDILCYVLSFLPMKEAAKTSLLSKRWRHLFLRVPKLIANDRDAYMSPNVISFVNRWIMSSKEVPISEMRLKSSNFEPSVFSLWLTTLILRRIKVLSIDCGVDWQNPGTLVLPEDFFRSETLVELAIMGRSFLFQIPNFICFPSLKRLDLVFTFVVSGSNHFRFVDDAYPLLEYFVLSMVTFAKQRDDETAILTISLPALKKLVFHYDELRRLKIDRIDIVTPHLHHLGFLIGEDTKREMQVNFSKCDSLVSAEIYQFGSGESYLKLLSQINNVKTLKLSDDAPEDYHDFAGSFPQFLNLTRLTLRRTVHESVWTILQHAPNLEVLNYNLSFRDEDYLPPEDVPQCLSQSLVEIKISGYKWQEEFMNDDEIEVDEIDDIIDTVTNTIQYFLQHGAVLKRMWIRHPHPERTPEWRQSTLNLLQSLVRLSPDCEIVLQQGREWDEWE